MEEHYSDEMLREIGLLFMTAAGVETALNFQLAKLSCFPGDLHALALMPVWGMETKVKLEKISTLSALIFKERAQPVARICDKLRRSFRRRNELTHYLNSPTGKTDTILLTTYRPNARGEMDAEKVWTRKQVRELTIVLLGRSNQLVECLTQIGLRPVPKWVGLTLEPNRL